MVPAAVAALIAPSELGAQPHPDSPRRVDDDVGAIEALAAFLQAAALRTLVESVLDEQLGGEAPPVDPEVEIGDRIGLDPSSQNRRIDDLAGARLDDRVTQVRWSGALMGDRALDVPFGPGEREFVAGGAADLELWRDRQARPLRR